MINMLQNYLMYRCRRHGSLLDAKSKDPRLSAGVGYCVLSLSGQKKNIERKTKQSRSGVISPTCGADRTETFFLTFGFSGTGGPLTSADMRDTDFLGGNTGGMSSLAGGATTLGSSPTSAPFTPRSVGRPPETRVGRGGGTGVALSVGVDTKMLLRLGGSAGDVSPLKQNGRKTQNIFQNLSRKKNKLAEAEAS